MTKDKSQLYEKFKLAGIYIAAFCGAFLLAILSASTFTPVTNSSAEEVSATVDSTGYHVSITAAPKVSLDVIATPDGAAAIGYDTLTVKTNSTSGYKLYVSMNTADTNGDRLYKDGDANSNYYLSAIDGKMTTPLSLVDSASNVWGWAVPGAGAFDSVYIDSKGNASDGTAGAFDANKKFAAVPLLGKENDALVSSTNKANDTTGEKTKIYYGVKANTAMPSGTYTGTVVYTAVADASSVNTGQVSVSPSFVANSKAGGETITFATSLYTNIEGLGNVSVTIGDKECTNASVFKSDGGSINVTCTTPAQDAYGTYEAKVSFEKFNKNYATEYSYYVPWDNLHYMQDMTAKACSEAPKPLTDATTVFNGANIADIVAGTQVPEKILTDSRDGTEYRIRRFADGYCWMTENLQLTLAANGVGKYEGGQIVETGVALNKTNTDLHAQDSWSQGIKMQTTAGITWGVTEEETGAATGQAGASTYLPSVDEFGNVTAGTQLANGATVYNSSKAEVPRSYYDNHNVISTLDGDQQEYGHYYNWYTATAHTGTYKQTSGNATDSICPRGWQLPVDSTAKDSKSWYNLLTNTYGITNSAEGSAKMRNIPLSLVFSGDYYWYTGALNYRGGGGFFWSSTAFSATYARGLYFGGSNVYPQDNGNKVYGFSIRCVAR